MPKLKKCFLLLILFSFLAAHATAKNVTVIYNFPAGTFTDIEESTNAADDANAFNAFIQVAAAHNMQMDMTYYPSFDSWFINGINGINNSAGQYWHFWVNAEFAPVGISAYVPANGDTIELGFADAPSKTRQTVINDAITWLAAHQDSNGQIGSHAVWGNAFALMALNLSAGNDSVKQNAQGYLLANQTQDAGFAYPGYDADALHTGVSIMALIANGLSVEDFNKGNNTAIDFLLSKQENDAGFSGWGSSDVDTTAWAILAFAAASTPMPTKNSKTPIDYLFSAQNADGGFGYKAGQNSSEDYSAEALVAFAAAGQEKNQAINAAIAWLKGKQQPSGCLSNAYTTALGAMALIAYNRDANSALQCLKGMQLLDKGFGRDALNSNAPDTAIAAIALSGKTFPTKKAAAPSNPNLVPLNSVVKFTVTITNNGKIAAKNLRISLNGLPSDWIQTETSTLSIPEIKPNETKQADIYVNMLAVGERTVFASVTADSILGSINSNLLSFEIAAANLSVSLSMQA
jgi:uncharacterized repeat protein (TIGR01451 family)